MGQAIKWHDYLTLRIFLWVEEVFAHNQSDRILLLRTVLGYGWANDQITKVHSLSLIPILRECSSYVEVDSAREYWTVSVCRQFLEDGGLFQWNSLKFTDEFCLCALKSAPSFSSHTSGLDEMLTEGGFGWGEILRLTDSEKSDGIKSESLILTGFRMGLFEGWTWLGWKCHEGTVRRCRFFGSS